jgi:hypothetical protein
MTAGNQGNQSDTLGVTTLLLGPFAADEVSGSFSPLLLSPETMSKVRWDIVFDQGPRGATVFGLSTLGLLLITSAVEISTGREGDANEVGGCTS